MREKANYSDPTWKQMEGRKLEELAKKHQMALNPEVINPSTVYTTEFKRCGYAYSKRLHSLVVENNAVGSGVQAAKPIIRKGYGRWNSVGKSPAILQPESPTTLSHPTGCFVRRTPINSDSSEKPRIPSQRSTSSGTTSSCRSLSNARSTVQNHCENIEAERRIHRHHIRNDSRNLYLCNSSLSPKNSKMDTIKNLGSNKIEKNKKVKVLQHPYCSYQKFKKMNEDSKAPCMSTKKKQLGFVQLELQIGNRSGGAIIKTLQNTGINNPIFQKNNIPCICSSGLYETSEERERREKKEKQKYWITPKGFNAVFSKDTVTCFIPNYVTRDPSSPPALHQFRDQDRSKWIAGGFQI